MGRASARRIGSVAVSAAVTATTTLALLVGFIAAGGPAFADAGYDFKAGRLLHGRGANPAFELVGRRQQLFAGLVGMAVAGVVVALTYHVYFDRNLFPPLVQVYAKAIQAGVREHFRPNASEPLHEVTRLINKHVFGEALQGTKGALKVIDAKHDQRDVGQTKGG